MRDLSKVVTWADILIMRGREAGLSDGEIVLALQNRLRGGDDTPGTGAIAALAVGDESVRVQLRALGYTTEDLEIAAAAKDSKDYQARMRARGRAA